MIAVLILGGLGYFFWQNNIKAHEAQVAEDSQAAATAVAAHSANPSAPVSAPIPAQPSKTNPEQVPNQQQAQAQVQPAQPSGPSPTQPPTPGNQELSSQQPSYSIYIQSVPSGARISIDGQSTGMITPAQLPVEANKEFTVALRKDGFQYYERRERAVENGHVIKASLLPMPKMGYINLDLINGGSNPVVFINGLRIEEKLPLRNYAVIAGAPVKIEAHNPFTGLTAEQVVSVGSNQRIQVNLILSQRKPSNQNTNPNK
jgi:hypothetical protein